ncbi:hypothetical protein ACFVYV_25070 [Streptomyces mirabilis]|uniref:hypothetical protein n=1 Tax=Streptomyces mirabilis TaxID=68239 RepID=UPI0036D8F92D
MAAAPQKTGIRNADEMAELATTWGLPVTVKTTYSDNVTSHTVTVTIPVPTAYAGTELGRTLAAARITLLWTKPAKGRARLEDATLWNAISHRALRTMRLIAAAIETMGRDAKEHARAAAPLPTDVVDAPHALYIDGELRKENIPAERVRTFVKNRRFNGLVTHQDADGGIVCDNRRYVPVTAEPAPAEDPYNALIASLAAADTHSVVYEVTASENGTIRQCPAQEGKRMMLAVGIKHSGGARVEGNAELFTVDWRGVEGGPGEIVFTFRRRTEEQRMHVRTVNGGTPEIIPTRTALDEINAAMMQPGKRAVREMSAKGSHARIAYKDVRGEVTLRPATAEEAAADIKPESERYAPGNLVIVRPVVFDPETRKHRVLPEYAGTVVNWASPHYNVRSTVADEHGHGVRPCRTHELRLATEEEFAAEADRIRAEAAREAYAFGVRLEAQQLGTNQVIEERARESLASVLHEEAGEGKAGFVFRTNHRGVWLRGVTSEGDDWPLLTEALQLHLEHYGWFVEPSRGHGVSITPPGDAGELVMEGKRRSVAAAHGQALAEHAQR